MLMVGFSFLLIRHERIQPRLSIRGCTIFNLNEIDTPAFGESLFTGNGRICVWSEEAMLRGFDYHGGVPLKARLSVEVVDISPLSGKMYNLVSTIRPMGN